METLIEQLQATGTSSLGAFWLPLTAWTLMAVPVLLGLRLWKSAHPLVQYYAHRALLLALPLAFILAPILPIASFAPGFLSFGLDETASDAPFIADTLPAADTLPPAGAVDFAAVESPSETAAPSPVPAAPAAVPDAGSSSSWFILFLGVLSGVAVLLAVVRFGLFLYQAYALRRFHAGLRSVEHVGALHLVERLRTRLDIRRPVALFTGGDNDVPMTFGWRRPTIVLPSTLLRDEAALEMALMHEMVHISRGDFIWGLIERFVCCLFAIHPAVWVLHERIAHFREASCDSEVLANRQADVRNYASLLVSFHRSAPAAGTAALSMVKPGSNLKQRIAAMKQFKNIQMTSRLRRNSVIFGVLLLILPAFITACYTRISSSTEIADSAEEAEAVIAEEAEAVYEEEVAAGTFSADFTYELSDEIAEQAEQASLEKEIVAQDLAHYRAQMLVEQKLQAEQERIHGIARLRKLPEDLKRLEVQIDYLTEQLKTIEIELHGLRNGKIEEGDLKMTRDQLLARNQLLQRMYHERLERYEMMKMEVETERRLRGELAEVAVSGVLNKVDESVRVRSAQRAEQEQAQRALMSTQLEHKIKSLNHQMAAGELRNTQLQKRLNSTENEDTRLDLMRAMEQSKAEMQQLKAEMEALNAHMEDLQRKGTLRLRQRVAPRANQDDN